MCELLSHRVESADKLSNVLVSYDPTEWCVLSQNVTICTPCNNRNKVNKIFNS